MKNSRLKKLMLGLAVAVVAISTAGVLVACGSKDPSYVGKYEFTMQGRYQVKQWTQSTRNGVTNYESEWVDVVYGQTRVTISTNGSFDSVKQAEKFASVSNLKLKYTYSSGASDATSVQVAGLNNITVRTLIQYGQIASVNTLIDSGLVTKTAAGATGLLYEPVKYTVESRKTTVGYKDLTLDSLLALPAKTLLAFTGSPEAIEIPAYNNNKATGKLADLESWGLVTATVEAYNGEITDDTKITDSGKTYVADVVVTEANAETLVSLGAKVTSPDGVQTASLRGTSGVSRITVELKRDGKATFTMYSKYDNVEDSETSEAIYLVSTSDRGDQVVTIFSEDDPSMGGHSASESGIFGNFFDSGVTGTFVAGGILVGAEDMFGFSDSTIFFVKK